MHIKAAMPRSECSVFFVVISVDPVEFSAFLVLAFSFFSPFLPTLEFERPGGKPLHCFKLS